jgi:hypothetical protein
MTDRRFTEGEVAAVFARSPIGGGPTTPDQELPLRLIVHLPPPGVRFALQRGPTATAELVAPTETGTRALAFEATVRVGAPGPGGRPRLLGPYVHGSPDARFLYVNSGRYAGDSESRWSRRAKVWLDGITTEQVRAVLADRRLVLEAEIAGTGKDGGPVCASTRVLGEGWRLASRGADPRAG